MAAAATLVLSAAACSRSGAHGPPPPAANFIVETDDSAFWVSTSGGDVKVRGVPLILARYGGRFYELYTSDDDFSYEDALLLGQRLYRRDLVTDDSAMVFADTVVPRVAAAYAKAHPDEQPLNPDEDVDPDARTQVTAEVDILEVFGPYLSYEYHLDTQLPGKDAAHRTRRGVLDLRDGRHLTLADLFGADSAQRIAASGQHEYQLERDSLLRTSRSASREAAAALKQLQFDEHSFTLAEDSGVPTVRFNLPARTADGDESAFDLSPVAAATASWWGAVRPSLPWADSADDDIWAGKDYRVVARYDTSGHEARLSIVDGRRREWPVATVEAPVRRIDWLDQPRIDAATTRALNRAFDEAATYDEDTRVASLVTRAQRVRMVPARFAPRSQVRAGAVIRTVAARRPSP